MGTQALDLADVQAKLGALLIQIMAYEKRIAEQDALIAELRAGKPTEGPVPFPKAVEPSRAELLGSA